MNWWKVFSTNPLNMSFATLFSIAAPFASHKSWETSQLNQIVATNCAIEKRLLPKPETLGSIAKKATRISSREGAFF